MEEMRSHSRVCRYSHSPAHRKARKLHACHCHGDGALPFMARSSSYLIPTTSQGRVHQAINACLTPRLAAVCPSPDTRKNTHSFSHIVRPSVQDVSARATSPCGRHAGSRRCHRNMFQDFRVNCFRSSYRSRDRRSSRPPTYCKNKCRLSIRSQNLTHLSQSNQKTQTRP